MEDFFSPDNVRRIAEYVYLRKDTSKDERRKIRESNTRINQTTYNSNSSSKKIPNKNNNNNRPNKNIDISYKTNDINKNIVVKIDLTKI